MLNPVDPWWWWPSTGTATAGSAGPGGARSAGSAGSEPPVLFFPPAGADQTVVAPLVAHLPGVRLGVLRLPGRGARSAEPAPTDLTTLVEQVAATVAALPGPAPLLVGHSFGTLLAFAVGLKLTEQAPDQQARTRRAGAPARLVAVAGNPPSASRERAATLRADGPAAVERYVTGRVAQLLAEGGVPAGVAADPQLEAAARAALAVDVRLSVQPLPPARLDCPITVVLAREDTLVGPDAEAGWRAATTAEVDRITVPGGHFFYRDHPIGLARLLRGELDHLARS